MMQTFKGPVLALALCAGPAAAQEIDLTGVEGLLENAVTEGAPGVAIGIVYQGEVVFEGYRGLADLENAIAIGPQTRFNIASNAKQFTALEVLRRVEAGELALDDDIRAHLPELYPNYGGPITLRDLIVHSSGLRDVYDLWGLQGLTWWAEFVGNDDALALLADQSDLNFEPGSDHMYSNSNYLALAEIVERVSEQSFDDATRPLFDRLGMTDTAFTTGHMQIIPNRARGYANFGEWVAFPAITDLYGDGWLRTTLPDQLRYEMAVQGAEAGSLVATSQRLVDGSDISTYGYGLEHATDRGLTLVHHDGSTGAHNASLSRFPDQQLSIVVMSNSGQVSTRFLATQIADALLAEAFTQSGYPEYPEAILARPANADLLGLYSRTDAPSLIRIVERSGELFRELEGRDPARLMHDQGHVFEYETLPGLRAAFDTTGEGRGRMTLYYVSQEPLTYIRVPAAPRHNAYLVSLTGRFENPETGSTLAIGLGEAGGLVLDAFGTANDVTPAVEDVLVTSGYTLEAIRDAAGRVTRYELSNSRLRGIRYERRGD